MVAEKVQTNKNKAEETETIIPSSEEAKVVAAPTVEEDIKIGNLLRGLRQQKGLSLDDVVADIRIRKVFLEALENENFAELPERTYALGYLRVYLTYLEVKDVENYLVQMDKSYNFSDPDYHNTEYASPLEEKYSFTNILKDNLKNRMQNSAESKSKDKKKKLLPILLLIIIVIGAVYMFFFMPKEKDKSVANLNVEQPNPNKVFSDSSEYVTKDKSTNNGNNEITIEDNNSTENTKVANTNNNTNANPNEKNNTATENKAEANVVPVEKTEEFRFADFPKETKGRTIKITFSDDVWVRIYSTKDKHLIYLEKIFKAGDVYEVPGVDGLAMNIADYEKVNITASGNRVFLYNNKKYSHVVNNIALNDNDLLNKYSRAR